MKFERKFFVLPPFKLVNGSYMPVNSPSYANPNNPIFKNRHALPNLPMQSTFKSLLSIPVNTSSNNNNANSYPSLNGNNGLGNGSKVYYRPQDLTAANLANRLQNKNNENIINNLNSSNEKLKNELYLLQKNSTERLYNGLPASPIPSQPATTIKSGKRISARKLTINSSPTIATRNLEDQSIGNDTQKSRSLSPIDTNSKVPNHSNNENKSSLNNNVINGHSSSQTPPPLPPPPVTQRHTVPVTVTPINITNTSNVNNNVNSTTPNPTTNYIATKTTSLITTTTTTTEHLNSIVRRTPTPTNNYQSNEDSANINNQNQKLRSWSALNNNNNNTQSNALNIINNSKNITDKAVDNTTNGNLTTWKSTAATSTQSDKQIVIEKSNVNEIKIQPRETFNVCFVCFTYSCFKTNFLQYSFYRGFHTM